MNNAVTVVLVVGSSTLHKLSTLSTQSYTLTKSTVLNVQ